VLNLAVVMGNLIKAAQVRALPSGLWLTTFDLQVRWPDRSPDTVPVALFDAPEQASQWSPGQGLLAVGHVRRRFFRTGGSTQSRTELVAEQVLLLEQTETVRTALAHVGPTIAGALEDVRSQQR
jgi:single-strand DNA-binding protein